MRLRFTITVIALVACLPFALYSRAQGVAPGIASAHFLASYNWRGSRADFGGFSALELDPSGQYFYALTDRTVLMQGRLLRERDPQQRRQNRQASGEITGQTTGATTDTITDAITGVELIRQQDLLDPNGASILGKLRDSEGLALSADGRLFVSFEAEAKVWAYAPPWGRATPLPRHPDFAKLRSNSSLEALAIDSSNRLYSLPEIPLHGSKNLPLYVFEAGRWHILKHLSPSVGFAPVGADFGPDGLLYLLERNFGGIGFRSQVRRFDLSSADTDGEILFTSSLGQHDNLEALSVWRDAQQRIRLTMLSDDNFKFFQKTEFVEYAVTEKLAKAAVTY